jgi:hypothetical protein
MPSMLDHLNHVSIFSSALALLLILAMNWAFTLIHILQEWKGEVVPLWRVFGAIVGVRLPDRLGFATFTVLLTVIQWAVGLAGIAGWWPIVGPLAPATAICALGAVIGARIGDNVVSHWGLYSLGYRPNPGLSTTILYAFEVVFVLATFWQGLAHAPLAAWTGIAAGVLFFCLVLPLLRGLGWLMPAWRHQPWTRGEPLPSWATE